MIYTISVRGAVSEATRRKLAEAQAEALKTSNKKNPK